MKTKNIFLGIGLIILGIGLFVYYDFCIKPDREARALLVEGRMIYEREDKISINNAINVFTKIIAQYPESDVVADSFYHIGRCYEKLGLNRLAYLKYVYVLKNNAGKISGEEKREILVRLAHIKALKQHSEEAVNQLYSLLNSSYNKEFRSRIYTELGHTYMKQSQYKRAKRMYDISLSEYGSNEDALIGRARAFKRMGRDNEAYDLYDQFLKYYGAVSQYTSDVRKQYRDEAYNSGLNAFRHGRYSAAISFLNRVLVNFYNDKKSENALYWTGESYYAMRQFDRAIGFFNRTLANGYYHKDQDARIKKGYAYFSSKRFDLAAREFQLYLRYYPRGTYVSVARNWKEMSTRELLLRMKARKAPELKQEVIEDEEELLEQPKTEVKTETETEKNESDQLEDDLEEENDEEISGEYKELIDGRDIVLENVAEL